MTERTPPLGIPTNDPEQLPLGMFEGTPLVPERPRSDGGDEADADAAVAVREPPVCGEWSFDANDDADARGGAMFVDSGAKAAAQTSGPLVKPRENTLNAARRSTAAPEGRAAAPSAPSPSMRALRTPAMQRSITPPTPLPALEELKSIHEAHPGDVRTAVRFRTRSTSAATSRAR